jgi:peptide/nickel transport system permease protein
MNIATKKLLRQTNLIMGGIITLFVIVVAVFASFLAPYHPIDDADLMLSEEPPRYTFWFGTDNQGRGVLSRVIYGARISLAVGLICQAFNTLIGVVLG